MITFPLFHQFKNGYLSGKVLVSYDVAFPFTSFLLQETIGIAINLIFNHNQNLNITKKELKSIIFFATSQTHFLFNGKLYNQIEGVAMAFPLSPVFAHIFMDFYESKWLNENNLNKPKDFLMTY